MGSRWKITLLGQNYSYTGGTLRKSNKPGVYKVKAGYTLLYGDIVSEN